MASAKQIIFAYYPIQFVECTLSWALSELCKEYGLKYTEYRYGPGERGFDKIQNAHNSILFFICDTYRESSDYECLKKWKNLRTVQLGGDVHYSKNSTLQFKNIDLHIDTMYQVEEQLKGKIKGFSHYYWSIAQRLINKIKETPNPTEKTNDVICLSTNNTKYRKKLFGEIAQKFKLLVDLKENDIDKIIGHYKNSYVTFGTSSSCSDFMMGQSMKGFRDWIGPFCDSVLIYDRIEEMDCLNEIVPKYHDRNVLEVIGNFISDKDKRAHYIKKQQEWALQNTIDKQFARILLKLKFLKKEEVWNVMNFVCSLLLKTAPYKQNY